MRSCSSSTASMKVKNVKKWVDTQSCTNTLAHTPASACLLHLSHIPPSLCSSLFIALTDCLSPLFPAWVPFIPSVYFCVFLLLSLPLFALCSLLKLVTHTHTQTQRCYREQRMKCQPNCVCVCYFFQTLLHQGPLPKTGRVCSLPLWKCGLWHNSGRYLKSFFPNINAKSNHIFPTDGAEAGLIALRGVCLLQPCGFKCLVELSV